MGHADQAIFAMYFSTIAGWQYHPGSGHGEHKILSLDQAFQQAVLMFAMHKEFFSKEV